MEASARRATGWSRRRLSALAVALTAVLVCAAAAYQINVALSPIPGANEYNIIAWEARNLPAKWLFEIGSLFRGDLTPEEEDESIRRFLALTQEIDSLEQSASNSRSRAEPVEGERDRLMALEQERDRIENQVEDTIEERIGTVAKEEGITRSTLLFGRVVFPPVDFEFTDSPRSLATSPRDHIELLGTTLLSEDLALQEVTQIEAEKLREENLSALAFPTGGIGAYPTLIDYTMSYRGLLEVVAHEWMHNYLALRPLGFNYYDSAELRALNETVADLAGRELALRALERWPLEEPSPPGNPSPSPAPDVDTGAVLRALRLEVDALLAAGEIETAEALMEQRRRELAEQGVFIRKINQAYFAFTNLYAGEAGSPGATNPIGPKIDELRSRSGSLSEFVSVVGGITSVEELDRALAQSR